ncbi:DUF3042 family protein [Lactococcus fujiensis]|uniref:DUF3042 domain-containing protein n=1 Tax=Lactococcus fujiensis JCM 16395 TaxID=1291764 RepID=A0A2A5RPA6_9LACT|nr:DUF3042 family protein [Lactococcus fujiensis]PCS01273.1 hypothetical protein RT41_GL000037 [Lactococcus fujiensis JCM 16395]
MNKFVKGYLVGKSIEIAIATAALIVAKATHTVNVQEKEDFLDEQRKKAQRKRLSR